MPAFIILLCFIFYYEVIALTPLPIQSNDGFCVSYKMGNLLYLGPAKTMTKMIGRVHCEMSFMKQKGSIDEQKSKKLAKANICYKEQQDEMIATAFAGPFNGWGGQKRFFIWRDPLDRFLSIYGHICRREHLCGSAGKNVHSFARGVYEMLKSGHAPDGSKDYLRLKHHAIPQSWYCDISKHRKTDQVIEYTKNSALMQKKLERVFRTSTVPKWMYKQALRRVVEAHVNDNKKLRGQYVQWRREILTHPNTLAYFKAIYHSDYTLFGKVPPGSPRKAVRRGTRRNWRLIHV
ncbi:unnamed protein product, partial [Mesorhabditis belari]|uniref:Uncharacterized protein n=1 Tax=Mesorhabditis belari TaxID=2138241 RepID=A0AAF3J4I9_9BILA